MIFFIIIKLFFINIKKLLITNLLIKKQNIEQIKIFLSQTIDQK